MSLSPVEMSELHDALHALRENHINAAQSRRLADLLAANPEARQLYLQHLLLAADLRWLLDKADAVSVKKAGTVSYRSQGTSRAKQGWRFTPRMIGLAASLLLVGYFMTIVCFLIWDGLRVLDEHRYVAGRHGNQPAALLKQADDAAWKAVPSGSALDSRTLEVRSGLAELRFSQGAKVVIEGPAEFEVRSPNAGFLHVGKLAAHVPAQAVGFQVETPTARIVDLGTDFRLEVTRQETQLAVTTGKVDLFAVDVADDGNKRTVSSPRRVSAGQAVAVAAETKGLSTVRETKFDVNWLSAVAPTASDDQLPESAVAYQVSKKVAGNESTFHGGVGLDFEVRSPIRVFSLGVFDHLGDGIDPTTSPTVQLWSRELNGTPDNARDDTGGKVLATQVFSAKDSGELKLGHRFKSLPKPIELPIGSYTIVAYNLADANPFIEFENTNVDPLNNNRRWTFDGTLADSTGLSNGTFSGDTPAYAPGKMGRALDLDGTNNYVTLPHDTHITAYTIAAWIKPRDVTAVNIMARGSADINAGSNMMVINANSKFEHSIYATNGYPVVTSTTTIQANRWYHVAIVAENRDLMRLYVNGVEEGKAQNLDIMWSGGDRFRVGVSYPNNGLGSFNGLVDDVRIYDEALSPRQIQAIFADKASTVPVVKLKQSTTPGQVETWKGLIVPLGSRFGECEPGMFPKTPRGRKVNYAAGSFEYGPRSSVNNR